MRFKVVSLAHSRDTHGDEHNNFVAGGNGDLGLLLLVEVGFDKLRRTDVNFPGNLFGLLNLRMDLVFGSG